MSKEPLPTPVQALVNDHLADRELNRHGFVRRVVSLIKGRLNVSEWELSRAMRVYAQKPRRGRGTPKLNRASTLQSAVQNWCGAKRERPGKRPHALLELILLGDIKLQRSEGKGKVELLVTPCTGCGTPTKRKGRIETCPACGTRTGADMSYLSLDMDRIQAEAQSLAGIASACSIELKSLLMLGTMIACHPSGIKLWYPTNDHVAQWTPEVVSALQDAAAASMKVKHEDGEEETIRPDVIVEQDSLASVGEGNVVMF